MRTWTRLLGRSLRERALPSSHPGLSYPIAISVPQKLQYAGHEPYDGSQGREHLAKGAPPYDVPPSSRHWLEHLRVRKRERRIRTSRISCWHSSRRIGGSNRVFAFRKRVEDNEGCVKTPGRLDFASSSLRGGALGQRTYIGFRGLMLALGRAISRALRLRTKGHRQIRPPG